MYEMLFFLSEKMPAYYSYGICEAAPGQSLIDSEATHFSQSRSHDEKYPGHR